VEEGLLDHPVTRLTAQEYCALARRTTTIPWSSVAPLSPLKALLQDVAGPDIHLVDSAEAMADATAELLQAQHLTNPERIPPEYRFYVTDVPLRFQQIGERFLGRSLPGVERVQL
jgi:glutamate racemase